MSDTNQGVMPRKRSRIRRSKSAEGHIGHVISRGAGRLRHAPRNLTPTSGSKPATLGIIKKSDVRFGVKEGGQVFFTKEERFAWQKAHKAFDVLYDIPDPKTPPFSFGTSTRDDWKKIFQNTRDLHNPQAGPGNYKTESGLNFLSEFPSRRDITFGIASRESAGLTTASPGVLYKIDGIFKNGTTKGKILPRFNLDTRKPLADNIKSTTSAVYWPQLSRKGGAVWFGSREQDRFEGEVDKISRRSPGPIYDVAKYGPTGPKFSFGASRRDRWGNLREPTIL